MIEQMRELTCPTCGHTWNYKGSNEKYAVCYACKSSVPFNPTFPKWKRDTPKTRPELLCKNPKCDFRARVKGYCVNCYEYYKNHGRLQHEKENEE